MDDLFPKDENSARVDFDVSPESGVAGQEPVKFNIKEQQDRFLGGSSGESPKPEGGIIPESETAVENGQEKGFDIRDKTIPLSDLEINFPYAENLPAGRKRDGRFMHLRNPSLFPKEIQANDEYLKGVKQQKAEEIINELRKRGHRTNLLVRGLGRFYDESSPPIQGVMNFHELPDIEKGQDSIVNALSYVIETRLINNAEVIEGGYSTEVEQEVLKSPVAVMVADRTKSTKLRDGPGYYDYDIKPDAVIGIFPFHIDDPLVRDFIK